MALIVKRPIPLIPYTYTHTNTTPRTANPNILGRPNSKFPTKHLANLVNLPRPR